MQVYGETSYELIEEVIKEANISEDDIFLDLGSGVCVCVCVWCVCVCVSLGHTSGGTMKRRQINNYSS